MPDVVIIDSGGANLASLRFALKRLGVHSAVSADARVIAAAPRVILPGVGAAGGAMERLHGLGLFECLRNLSQPVLGICLGMQLLFDHSAEGDTQCLGLLPGKVEPLLAAPGHPVPHMGWNNCRAPLDGQIQRSTASAPVHGLLQGIRADEYFYFVHGFAAPVTADTAFVTDYVAPFSAVVRRGNLHGVQFHPERSARAGARVLSNFLHF